MWTLATWKSSPVGIVLCFTASVSALGSLLQRSRIETAFSFSPFRLQAYWLVTPTPREGLPASVNHHSATPRTVLSQSTGCFLLNLTQQLTSTIYPLSI